MHQSDDVTPQAALKLYEQYKKEFNLSKSRKFFERHKTEEWWEKKKFLLFFLYGENFCNLGEFLLYDEGV